MATVTENKGNPPRENRSSTYNSYVKNVACLAYFPSGRSANCDDIKKFSESPSEHLPNLGSYKKESQVELYVEAAVSENRAASESYASALSKMDNRQRELIAIALLQEKTIRATDHLASQLNYLADPSSTSKTTSEIVLNAMQTLVGTNVEGSSVSSAQKENFSSLQSNIKVAVTRLSAASPEMLSNAFVRETAREAISAPVVRPTESQALHAVFSELHQRSRSADQYLMRLFSSSNENAIEIGRSNLRLSQSARVASGDIPLHEFENVVGVGSVLDLARTGQVRFDFSSSVLLSGDRSIDLGPIRKFVSSRQLYGKLDTRAILWWSREREQAPAGVSDFMSAYRGNFENFAGLDARQSENPYPAYSKSRAATLSYMRNHGAGDLADRFERISALTKANQQQFERQMRADAAREAPLGKKLDIDLAACRSTFGPSRESLESYKRELYSIKSRLGTEIGIGPVFTTDGVKLRAYKSGNLSFADRQRLETLIRSNNEISSRSYESELRVGVVASPRKIEIGIHSSTGNSEKAAMEALENSYHSKSQALDAQLNKCEQEARIKFHSAQK